MNVFGFIITNKLNFVRFYECICDCSYDMLLKKGACYLHTERQNFYCSCPWCFLSSQKKLNVNLGKGQQHVIMCVIICACADFEEQPNTEIPLNYDVSLSQESRLYLRL